jgi:phage tail sheath protein FI
MPFQLSPGVAVVEKDFSSIVPAVSSSVGAFAGSFSWGPVMQPVTVSSENVLVQQFGGPNDSNFQSFFSAANFLSYANNLLLVRADSTLAKNAVATPTGGLSGLALTTAGTGYSSTAAAPAVTVSAPQITGGVQAVVSVTITGGAITAVAITNGGSGYSVAPTVNITSTGGGSGATFTVILTAGAVSAVTVDTGGTGYKGTVTAAVSSGNAVLGSVTVASSSIATATIVTAGSGYSSAPTVTVANPPSGTVAVLTPTLASAGVKIKNSENYLDTYANGAGVVGEFAAKYPGTQGNSISVSYCDSSTWATWEYKAEFDSAPSTSTYAASVGGTNDEIHLVITDRTGIWTGTPGTVLEKFPFVSKASDAKKPDGTGNHYRNVVNTLSLYVWWMDYPQGNTNWGTTAVSKAFSNMLATGDYDLSGGVDDFTMTDGQQQSAYTLFANAELYDVSLLIAGKASATNAAYIANIAQTRADCVAFVSPLNTVTGEVIIGNTSTETDALIAFRNAMNTIHSYAFMDSGFKYQYDRYNDKYRYVTLNADTAGLCARTDYTNDPWWSPGGYNRGQIKNVVRLAHNPDKTSRDMLYKAGINPVVSFPGQGVVLYGDKTMQTKPSAFDRINVRRLFIVVEKAIATAAKFQLFEFNDSFTRAQFKNLVEPFLRDVQGRRGIVDFRVKCDDTNNTGEVIDRNEFIADIFIKPNRSINYITLNFVAARSSANFTEIGG